MGIHELLRRLDFCTEKSNVGKFAGQRLAVDTSSWLHKASTGLGMAYVEEHLEGGKPVGGRAIHSVKQYLIRQCEELFRGCQIHRVILVLDGRRCSLKAATNHERDKVRSKSLAQARQLMREAEDQERRGYSGIQKRDQAACKYRNCCKASTALVKAVMPLVVQHFSRFYPNCLFVVQSPYEADAQLVKLCQDGVADAILTEDSDVLLYLATAGLADTPVIFKYLGSRNQFRCDIVAVRWLLEEGRFPVAPKRDEKKKHKKRLGVQSQLEVLALHQATKPGAGVRAFVQACCVTGSDYSIKQLEGVGIVGAFQQVVDSLHCDPEQRFVHLLSFGKHKCANLQAYARTLAQSECIFYYHPVLDLASGQIIHFTQPNQPHAPSLSKFGAVSFIGEVGPAPPVPSFCLTSLPSDMGRRLGGTPKPARHRLGPHVEHVPMGNPYQAATKGPGRKKDNEPTEQEKKLLSANFFRPHRGFQFVKPKPPPPRETMTRNHATLSDGEIPPASPIGTFDYGSTSVDVTQSQERCDVDLTQSSDEEIDKNDSEPRSSNYFSGNQARRVSAEELEPEIDDPESVERPRWRATNIEADALAENFDYNADDFLSPAPKEVVDLSDIDQTPEQPCDAVRLLPNAAFRSLHVQKHRMKTLGEAKVVRKNRFAKFAAPKRKTVVPRCNKITDHFQRKA